jgi:cytochrome c peroxidase
MDRLLNLFLALTLGAAFSVAMLSNPASAMPGSKKPSVELGKKLFSDPSLGTNGSTCSGCHPSEAQVAQLAAKKEWFGGKAKTLEQAINICIKGPLAGTPLPEDSVEVRSIAMYMKSQIKK